MLPNPHDAPAEPAEGAGHEPVPGLVGGGFFAPEGTVVNGQIGMPGATMPEAAIDEYREPLASENEVRLAEDGLMPPPAGDAVFAEQFGEDNFRLFVAAPANFGHHLRAFLFGIDVRHCLTLSLRLQIFLIKFQNFSPQG